MSQPDTNWEGIVATIVAAVVGIVGGGWALLKMFFSFVTRAELKETIAGMEGRFVQALVGVQQAVTNMDEKIELRHKENKDDRHALRNDLSGPLLDVQKEVARLAGRFDERYGERR